jgi:hypothetical protein
LNGLGSLELLDELHLEHVHLHDLLLGLSDRLQLLLDLVLDLHAGVLDLPALLLVNLLPCDLLLHLNCLLLVLVLLLDYLNLGLQALFVLVGLHLGLGSLLCLRVFDCLHDLLLLLLVHEAHTHVLLNKHFLFEFLFLLVLDLLGHAFVVTLFKAHNVGSSLLGLLNLLPGAHLFLFEQGNTVGKHVCILFNAIILKSS